MRTKNEIAEEITALKALKPTAPFAERTSKEIAAAIEELEHGVDQSAGEWNEMPDLCRDMVNQTIAWRDYHQDHEQPSKGFGSLVE